MKLRKLVLGGLTAAVLAVGSAAANAALIQGDIGFAGSFEGTGGSGDDLSDITGIDFDQAFVLTANGDFATFITPPESVNIQDFTFNPFSGPIASFWSVGGFFFELTSIVITQQTALQIGLLGQGILTGNGFDPTPGVWNFTGNQNGASATWSSSAAAVPVPEPATLGLLGLGLMGLGVATRRRRLAS